MFKIEGLFLDDFSHTHITAIKSLANYLDEILSETLTTTSLFSMQKEVYNIQQIGVDAFQKTAMQDRTFDCKAGCDSCCHATDVDITPAEAFYLANYIKQQDTGNQKKHISIKQRADIKAACPLLKDGFCSSYEVRPLACRYIMSTDIASCIKRLSTLTGGAKLPPPLSHFRTSITAATFVIFRKRSLDARWLILDKSIEKIVNDDSIVEDWLSGKRLNDNIDADEPANRFGKLISAVEAI